MFSAQLSNAIYHIDSTDNSENNSGQSTPEKNDGAVVIKLRNPANISSIVINEGNTLLNTQLARRPYQQTQGVSHHASMETKVTNLDEPSTLTAVGGWFGDKIINLSEYLFGDGEKAATPPQTSKISTAIVQKKLHTLAQVQTIPLKKSTTTTTQYGAAEQGLAEFKDANDFMEALKQLSSALHSAKHLEEQKNINWQGIKQHHQDAEDLLLRITSSKKYNNGTLSNAWLTGLFAKFTAGGNAAVMLSHALSMTTTTEVTAHIKDQVDALQDQLDELTATIAQHDKQTSVPVPTSSLTGRF